VREAVALGADQQRRPFGGRQPVQGDRVVGECHRIQGEAPLVQIGDGLAPGPQPRPRHLEDRSHADADAAPVQRVGAAGGDEDGVGAEGRRRAEDRAQIGVVDDVLDHDDQPGAVQHGVEGRLGAAVESTQRPAVQSEAGRGAQQIRIALVDGRVDAGGGEQAFELRPPLRQDEERPRRVPALERPLDDAERLRHEQAVRGLQAGAQPGVRQVQVVGQPRIGGIGHRDELHSSHCSGRPDRCRLPRG
jgi:hypothetical protein